MDYDKLIDAVKLCGSTPKIDQCKQCAYWSGGDMSKCIPRMTTAAAVALSALQAENAEMQKQLNEFSEFLCHITGGLLSKTNYTAQEMITTAEDYQQIRCDECDLRAENIRWGQIASEQDKAVERLQEENEKLKNAADSWKKKWAGLDKAVKNGSVYRPMREQVEKVWRAHWNESTHLGGFVYCSRCGYNALEANNYTFCPKCGSPFTDEAFEMVMERLEALHDTGD